jgi:hypothetical protein
MGDSVLITVHEKYFLLITFHGKLILMITILEQNMKLNINYLKVIFILVISK